MKEEEKENQSLYIRVLRLLFFGKFLIIIPALLLLSYFSIQSSLNFRDSIDALSEPNPQIALIEKGITQIYKADNNFRFYVLTSDSLYQGAYRSNLELISSVIDSLEYTLSDSKSIDGTDRILEKKTEVAENLVSLKRLTDSLLNLVTVFDTTKFGSFSFPIYDINRFHELRKTVTTDTITEITRGEKQSFLKKVKNLFKDDASQEVKRTIVNNSESISDTSTKTQDFSKADYNLLRDIHRFYQHTLSIYSDGRKRLTEKETELVTLNSKLLEALENVFEEILISENARFAAAKNDANHNARVSFNRMLITAGLAFLIATILYFMILTNLNSIKEYSLRLQLEKENSERLAEQKSTLLSNMSHEIRAPLNNIIGFTDLLNEEDLTSEQRKSMDGIASSSELLLATVNQILDFARLEAGKMSFIAQNFNPFEIIADVLKTNSPRAKKKKLVLKATFPENQVASVCGDPVRLKQVITNLVDNAIKYSDHGEITISAILESLPDNTFHLKSQVSDQGIGIPEDQLDNIFVEFTRIEDLNPRTWQAGTGLGLPICKRIIEQQNGTLHVSSKPGEGTVFTLLIPYQAPVDSLSSANEETESRDFSFLAGTRILLAEDDEFSTFLIEKIFSRYKIQFHPVTDGSTAFSALTGQHFDLVLTDINMPGMDGFEFIRKVRGLANPIKASTPVLAVTANVMDADLRKIMESGMNGYVFKPFREMDLIKSIASIIALKIN